MVGINSGFKTLDGVNLIHNNNAWYFIGINLLNNVFYLLNLIAIMFVCSIDYMKKHIGLAGFFKSRFKSSNQIMR